jgi:hypothetical protein
MATKKWSAEPLPCAPGWARRAMGSILAKSVFSENYTQQRGKTIPEWQIALHSRGNGPKPIRREKEEAIKPHDRLVLVR